MKSRRPISRKKPANKRPLYTQDELKFVPVVTSENRGGGWYRRLPDDRIEVMTRGKLERVRVGDADPEEKAKAVVRDIIDHVPDRHTP